MTALLPVWFVGFDSIMELISFLVAAGVGYQALKGFRLTREKTLLYIHFSFILLSAGLLIDALPTLLLFITRTPRRVFLLSELGDIIFFLAQLFAYGLLIFAYLQHTKRLASAATLSGIALFASFEANPSRELILVFMLAYITAQTTINYSIRRQTNSLLVMLCFALLTLGHVFFLLAFELLNPTYGVFANFLQLFGFLSLFWMLLRVNRGR